MNCVIYKSVRKQGYYLFVVSDNSGLADDGTGKVPQALLDLMGELSIVMELDIMADSRMLIADPGNVLMAIEKQGYYLHMPLKDH